MGKFGNNNNNNNNNKYSYRLMGFSRGLHTKLVKMFEDIRTEAVRISELLRLIPIVGEKRVSIEAY